MMPVDAAKIIPIKVTVIAKPPRILPNISCIDSIKRSATPDLSNIRPINMNIGNATNTQFSINENRRDTTKPIVFRSIPVMVPKYISDKNPKKPNMTPTPANT